MKRIAGAMAAVVASTGLLLIAQTRDAARLPACDPDNGGITLPSGFCALVAADNLGIGRQMAVAANGDLFVAIAQCRRRTRPARSSRCGIRTATASSTSANSSRPKAAPASRLRPGYVYLGQDTNGRSLSEKRRRAESVRAGGNRSRRCPISRDTAPKASRSTASGGLYVNVGAPSNACQSTGQDDRKPGVPGQMPCPLLDEARRHLALRREQDRPDATERRAALRHRHAPAVRARVARGLALRRSARTRSARHAVPEVVHCEAERRACRRKNSCGSTDGANFGWPYCYHDWQQGKRVQNPEYGGDGKKEGDCAKYPAPIAGIPGSLGAGRAASSIRARNSRRSIAAARSSRSRDRGTARRSRRAATT